jgi:hypothetical protein
VHTIKVGAHTLDAFFTRSPRPSSKKGHDHEKHLSHHRARRQGVPLPSLLVVAAAAAALTGLGLGSAGVAEASTYQFNNVYLSPTSSGNALMLDVSGGSTAWGAPVVQWWFNGGANQRWNINRVADGNSQIINVNSGQCLTTDLTAGDGLYQFPCVTGAVTQEWNIHGMTTNDSIGRQITNPYSGLRVDVYGGSRAPGATIDAWYDNGGGDNQFFAAWQ